MGVVVKPYDFNPHAANAKIDSSQVDANFDTLYTLANGNIDADNLKDGAATTAKIADGAVTAAKLAPDAVPVTAIGARVYHNATQSVTGGNAVLFNSERWDTDTCHDTATNNSRLTCNTAGKYLVVANVYSSTATTIFLRLNGTTNIAAVFVAGGGIGVVTTVYDLTAGDYIEVVSSASISISNSANAYPEFSMVRLGA